MSSSRAVLIYNPHHSLLAKLFSRCSSTDREDVIKHLTILLLWSLLTGAKESKSPEGQLKRVLAMLAEFSGNRALCSYVVDALWDSTKVLQVSP